MLPQQPVESKDAQGLVPSIIINPLWVVAVRLCITVTALLSVTACTFLGSEDTALRVRFLFTPVALLFVLNAASALLLQYSRAGIGFYFLHVLIDIPLVTGVVYITGGPASPFVFLYLLLVMVASVLITKWAGIVTSLLSSATYSLLIYSLYTGALEPADGIRHLSLSSAGLIVQSAGLCAGMLLVALGTSFLRSRLVSTYALVSESEASLQALTHEQDLFFEDFPAGVITTNLELIVKSINLAARVLLHLENQDTTNRSFSSLVTLPGLHRATAADWITVGSDHPITVEVRDPRSETPLQVEVFCRPIRHGLGTISGLAFLLNDVTKLKSAEEQIALQERMARLLSEQTPSHHIGPLGELIGESSVMQKVFEITSRVANTDATVLVTGESGTGKELVARAIHFGSNRASQPFVAVNCGAIPDSLIESELFGHKKGAFTGAESDTSGLIRQAHGGTLFLDEIGELPLLMQAKILRSLQERTVRPVGATTDIPVDVRIVAATNRNLKTEVTTGRFREDLYYRLNVIGIHLPALRDRREDIPLLVKSILSRYSRGDTIPTISPDALRYLTSYCYPGNVRELENILERAVVLGGDVILPEHLSDHVLTTDSQPSAIPRETLIIEDETLTFPIDLDAILAGIEKQYIERALSLSQGAKKKAATLLGMNFRSFRYRLQKFGLAPDNSSQEQ